jgi:hypothetical protein
VLPPFLQMRADRSVYRASENAAAPIGQGRLPHSIPPKHNFHSIIKSIDDFMIAKYQSLLQRSESSSTTDRMSNSIIKLRHHDGTTAALNEQDWEPSKQDNKQNQQATTHVKPPCDKLSLTPVPNVLPFRRILYYPFIPLSSAPRALIPAVDPHHHPQIARTSHSHLRTFPCSLHLNQAIYTCRNTT